MAVWFTDLLLPTVSLTAVSLLTTDLAPSLFAENGSKLHRQLSWQLNG